MQSNNACASAPSDELFIEPRPGHNGDVVLTARLGGNVLHQDQVAIAKAPERERFVEALCRGRAGIDADAVRQRLLELADEHERSHARRTAETKAKGTKAAVLRVQPYRPFPVDLLPEPVARFIWQGARAMGCDPAYLALPLLAALASAIGNTRRIRLKLAWDEPAVLWTTIVADSGTLKSPAMERALKPLYRRQKRILREYQRTLAEYQAELKKWKATPKDERGDEPQKPPAAPHLFCSDVTVEALADRLEKSPRGILVAVDELAGWFASFNQYKQGRGGDLTHYLAMYGARLLKVDRKTGDKTTIYVPHAAVSVNGTIQPGTLKRLLTPEFFENGMVARLMMAMPPRAPKRWTEADVEPAVEQALDEVFEALLKLKPDKDLDGDPTPVNLELTEGAKAAWVAFYEEHAQEQAELDGAELAAWSKLEGCAARLALIVQLIRVASGDETADENRVDEISIDAGVRLARWFGYEARRVYAALGETGGQQQRRELAELVRQMGGSVAVRDLRQRRRRYRDNPEQAEADLQALVDAGLGEWDYPKPGANGGQPAKLFKLTDRTDNDVNVNVTPAVDPATASNVDVDGVDGAQVPDAQGRERGLL